MYKKIIGPIVLACLISSQPTFAHSSECGKGLKEMVASLKLDDSQKEKVKPILEQLKSTMKDQATQMQALDSQMDGHDMTTMDDNSVNQLVDKKTAIIGNMMKAKMTAKKQIFAVLNDTQKTEFQNEMKKMGEEMAAKYKDCHDDD